MAGEVTSEPSCTEATIAKVEAQALFAKRKRNANIRKRTRDEDGDGSGAAGDDTTTVVHKPKAAPKPSPFVVSSAKEKKVESLAYESTRQVIPAGPRDQGATAVIEMETAHDRDARAIKERLIREEEQDAAAVGKEYRGMAAYGNLIQKREPKAMNEKMSAGPIRAPTNVRNTCRFDYQPDLCKDYKETGYCGYGDACKFMHDRGDYKTGWQLDREWNEQQAARSRGGSKRDEQEPEQDDEDEFPFACFICREPFKEPVVTKCKHYFCESCALKHYAKSSKCFACEVQTGGVFNRATKLLEKIEERNKAQGDHTGGHAHSDSDGDAPRDGSDETDGQPEGGGPRQQSGGWRTAQAGWAIL